MHRFTGRLNEVLDGLDFGRVWALGVEETGEVLRELYAAQARLAALRSAILSHAEEVDLPSLDAATSLKAWLRDQVRIAPGEAARQVKLARALGTHEAVREGLARGEFPPASAEVIVKVVDGLPDEADSWVSELAEKHLTAEAYRYDTQVLSRLAARLEEVVDPDGADERLAVQLARAEEDAVREAFLTLRHDEGREVSEGSFRIPLLQGVKLQRMVETFLNPASCSTRPDPIPFVDPVTGERVPGDVLRGLALTQLIDRIPTGRLPRTGGMIPTVVVTMELETLLGGLRAASLDTGHRISPGAARRLAARTGVIPAVLGTDSEVLDLGRRERFFRRPQRRAMAIRQAGTCAVVDCDAPTSWCEAAHLKAWQDGGPTDLANGALLCPRHHTLADHPDYTIYCRGPGRIKIVRTGVDSRPTR
ncbi:DUF222 domain-containing protein [Nocardioides sp.]|uniref:HNH endonuclease signature motif containing protein n=1 Tax=Nocardioides sp. TaxID=35761 RepID=UPI0039E69364